jgi:nucleoside-diphosphate-sugar epimerase
LEQLRVLVTGATGALGRRLVKRLVDEGYSVRVLARKRSNVGVLKNLGVEIAFGDLADEALVSAAVESVEIVVHAGAGTSGMAEDSDAATVRGTQNILNACRTSRVRKLVYISSCNVYEVAGYVENQVVTEEAQLERFPLRRGHYSAGKLRAEALVTEAMQRGFCPTVVLRLGTLYGPGAKVFTRIMGVSSTRRLFIVFGNGESALPLLHVDNAVDAIVECMIKSAAENQVFNVVDRDTVTKRMYMERIVKPLYPKATVIYCPMSLLFALTWLQEKLLAILGSQPYLSMYRLVSSQKCVRYATSKIEAVIGWRSRISFEQGAAQLISARGRAADTNYGSAGA